MSFVTYPRHRHAASAMVVALGIVLGATQLSSLDLAWMRLWLDTSQRGFLGQSWPVVVGLYRTVPWLGWCLLAVALLILLLPRWRRQPRLRRAAVGALLIAVLGNGVIIDAGLKSHWGRPRPTSTEPFGGSHPYTPLWRASSACARNCSLASGHAAAGFWIMAWGLMARRSRWHRWMAAGVAAGLLIGAARTTQGAHFPSDVLAAGLIILLCSLLCRRLWIRWRWWQRRRRARTARYPCRLNSSTPPPTASAS